MLTITLFFILLNFFCLRSFAKHERYESGLMFVGCAVASIIPYINIAAFVVFVILIIMYAYDDSYDIDEFTKKIFFIKDKEDDEDVDDYFKRKRHR